MTATDSMGDALVSAAILLSIAVYRITNVDMEPFVSIIFAVLILKTGIEMGRECLNKILGASIPVDKRQELVTLVSEEEGVQGVYGLALHSYGEDVLVGSVNVQVDEQLTALEIARLSKRIIDRAAGMGVMLTSVGISAMNLADTEDLRIYHDVVETAKNHLEILQIQGILADQAEKKICFKAVFDPKCEKKAQILEELIKEIEAKNPGMTVEAEESVLL